jgi:hypothetical protein
MTSDQDLYNELAYYTLSHGDASFIHQNLVDAYTAQHADEFTKPIAVVFALGRSLPVSGKELQRPPGATNSCAAGAPAQAVAAIASPFWIERRNHRLSSRGCGARASPRRNDPQVVRVGVADLGAKPSPDSGLT